ncbi:MAG: hypothetical protein IPH12_11615 [Saprospirales bacterium]|nr:hypothetical protein [Saprospirales bacterium]MBK8922110.1 hypothetical protein [Saprospirales bacterium]
MDQIAKATVLRAFLAENLSTRGHALDEETFRLIEMHVTLSETDRPESEEIRSVDIKAHTDGKVTAKMFSLFNVSQISLHDLFGLALKEMVILTMTDETRLKIALALLAVVHDFFKFLNTDLNELEAKVLLSVYDLNKPEYSAADVKEAFRQRFSKPISSEQLKIILDGFVHMTILKYNKRKELFSNRQKISLNR